MAVGVVEGVAVIVWVGVADAVGVGGGASVAVPVGGCVPVAVRTAVAVGAGVSESSSPHAATQASNATSHSVFLIPDRPRCELVATVRVATG